MAKGVPLTMGQAAGPGTFRNRVEQSLTSSPIGGQSIANRRNEAVQAGLLEAVNIAGDAMPAVRVAGANMPGAPRIDLRKAIREGAPTVDAASKDLRGAISDRYETLLEGVTFPGFLADDQMRRFASEAVREAPMMSKADAKHLLRFAKDRVPPGKLSGQDLKAIEAELNYATRTLGSSPDPKNRFARDGWHHLQKRWHEEVLQPNAPQLPDAAWRQQSAIDRSILPGHETMTPLRLAAQLDKSNLQNTPLGQHAADLLRSGIQTVPDSGTAGRSALMAMIGGGTGFVAGGVPGVLASAAIPAALGSRMVQRGLTGQTAAQKALRRADPKQKIDATLLSAVLASLRGGN
jgi:hypothetical protein